MDILPFDEDLSQREIVPYRPIYRSIFEAIKNSVEEQLPAVSLIHIGSTAVADLRGKPMIDIIAVTEAVDLRKTQKAFEQIKFHRRDVWTDRDDKPYVCGSITHRGERFNVNIHVCGPDHPVLRDTLRFVDQLKSNAYNRRQYENAKYEAHATDPADPESYNRAKEAVIIKIQKDNCSDA